MEKYQEIYEEIKKLDLIYIEKYNIDNNEMFIKNILSLLVEIGELANEVRSFKYWSIKKINEKSIIIEELADCILFTVVFMNMLDISLDEEFKSITENDINLLFIKLFNKTSNLLSDFNKENVKEILIMLIHVGKLLNYSDEEIIAGCFAKVNKNKIRLESSY